MPITKTALCSTGLLVFHVTTFRVLFLILPTRSIRFRKSNCISTRRPLQFDAGLSRIPLTSTMLQPRLLRPHAALESPLTALASSLNALSLCSRHSYLQSLATSTFVRHASHATQGRANGPGDSAGRRLGAKKTASEYVVPGNIIFKQRGKTFNCAVPFF